LSQDNLRTYLTANRKTVFVNLGPGQGILVTSRQRQVTLGSSWVECADRSDSQV